MIVLLLPARSVTAQEAGTIVSIVGKAEVFRAGRWQPAMLRQSLLPEDVVRTGPGSRVAILLVDESQIKVNANSTLAIKQVGPRPGRPVPAALGLLQTILNLLSGEIWIRSRVEPFEIQTPVATATIRGTEMNLSIGPADAARLAVLEGLVEFRNPQGSVLVAAGEQAAAKVGEAPRKTVLVNPLDAVQWSLYYPGIVNFRDYPLTAIDPALLPQMLTQAERRVTAAPGDLEARIELGEILFDLGRRAEARREFQRALAIDPQASRARAGLGWVNLVEGKVEAALGEFRQARPPPRSALVGMANALYRLDRFEEAEAVIAEAKRRFPSSPQPWTQAAFLHLIQGRVSEALSELEEALALDPRHALAHGLRSNIYLVQNKKDLALQAAQRAVAANPSSPSAHLDLSLAKQAEFQLEEALQAARKAVELAPEDPQALIQVSRLLFGLGQVSEAFKAAEQASRMAPQDPFINTTWGFLLLARGKVKEAIGAFDQAIQADSTRGQPHLGRGLALFRQGKKEEAVQEMWMATLLEPQVSLFQSYLAKALFEVNRPQEGRAALERAKALDPRDPTPSYYAGIYLADENKPGAAIREFQRAIALNDNRAIFRSRFLLDQDVAARGADLARRYWLLGLNQLAESLAVDALEDDPTSSSAHAFLAASARDLHPGTNVSTDEFIQALLLSPVSHNALHTLNRWVSLSPAGTRGSKGDYSVSGLTTLLTRGSISDRLRRESGRGLANFATSIGEYTSLVEAPGANISGQGAYESHDTDDENILGSGGTHRVAASLFAERFSTDGFRDINDDLTDYEVNGLVKAALGPQSDLSFAAVYSNVRAGDVFRDTNAFVANDPDLRVRQQLADFHLGYHRQFAPGSHLLALAQGGYSPARVNDTKELERPVLLRLDDLRPCPTCQALVTIDDEIRARPYFFDLQLQQHHRLGSHRLIVGGGYLRIQDSLRVEDFLTGTVTFPPEIVQLGFPPQFPIRPAMVQEAERPRRYFISSYVQDIWEITPKWRLTGGLRYDYAEDTRVDLSRVQLPRANFRESEVSPLLGLSFRPNPRHTFRLAAAKFFQPEKGIGVLPSLAPTHIAGVVLNQASSIFFPSARVWQYQAEWEFRPTATTFFNLTLFRRDIDAPFQEVSETGFNPVTGAPIFSAQIARDSFSRTGGALAWNQLLAEPLGLSADYLFARRSGMSGSLRSLLFRDASAEGEEDDHQVRLRLSFVHPDGWIARIGTTFVHQELGSGTRSPGAPENFVLMDLSLTKQLLRRRVSITFAVDNLLDRRFQLVSDALTLMPGETLTGLREPARRFSGVITVNF
jgi:tetratricopeptide (TPR) repeat protein/outer membrane receptor protein involved in Fe transport